MHYKGSCHCGKVGFEFKVELIGAVRCNCSICSRKGALLCAILHDSLTVLAWGDDLGTYTFGNHAMAQRSLISASGLPVKPEDDGVRVERATQPTVADRRVRDLPDSVSC